MRTPRLSKRLLIGVLGVPVVLVITILGGAFGFGVYQGIKGYICARAVRKTDPAELLTACRFVIANSDVFTEGCSNLCPTDSDGRQVCDLNNEGEHSKYASLPPSIQKLGPLDMVIGTNHVFIRLRNWPSVRIQAYASGTEIADSDKANYICELLTNGLWLRISEPDAK